MDKLSYDIFVNFDIAQQVEVFDHSVPIELFETEKQKRIFLQDLIQKNQNHYFRKKAIENLALMSLCNETNNNSSIVAALIDIEIDDDVFVLVSKIKYLAILDEKLEATDPGIKEQIDKLRFHENGDVSSEAYYRIGLRTLQNANSTQNKLKFFEDIKTAKNLFEGATELTENRTDALLLYQICDLISLFVSNEKKKVPEKIQEVTDTILHRRMSFTFTSIPEIEIWFYKIVLNIQTLMNTDTSEWLEIKVELNELCYLHYRLTDTDLDGVYAQSKMKFRGSITNNILIPHYKKSLKQHLSAIKRLLREEQLDGKFHKFCSDIIDNIENEQEPKKNIGIDIAVEIARNFPDVSSERLTGDLSKLNIDDPLAIIKLTGEYSQERLNKSDRFVTGSPQGDEIFNLLCNQIGSYLPQYPLPNFLDFKIVLSDVIKYVMIACTQKVTNKKRFQFLYKENADENDLQESMYSYLQMASDISRYSSEVSDIADGGRVDILFKSDNTTLPIELKKTDTKPTEESIKENYLSQAQTYCYPYNQLGLFVLLDNSKKADQPLNPINDIRELFNIQCMEPYYQFEKKAPNYVVTVVIPGNKITPSQRSNYK